MNQNNFVISILFIFCTKKRVERKSFCREKCKFQHFLAFQQSTFSCWKFVMTFCSPFYDVRFYIFQFTQQDFSLYLRNAIFSVHSLLLDNLNCITLEWLLIQIVLWGSRTQYTDKTSCSSKYEPNQKRKKKSLLVLAPLKASVGNFFFIWIQSRKTD